MPQGGTNGCCRACRSHVPMEAMIPMKATTKLLLAGTALPLLALPPTAIARDAASVPMIVAQASGEGPARARPEGAGGGGGEDRGAGGGGGEDRGAGRGRS